MMKGLYFLLIGSATVTPSFSSTTKCALDSSEAVSDLMDASLFMWAATKRCGAGSDSTHCLVDVSSAIKAVNSMGNVIVKVLDKCGSLHSEIKECGMAAGRVSEQAAAVVAAGGDLAAKCQPQASAVSLGQYTAPIRCAVNLKDLGKDLLRGASAVVKTKDECVDNKEGAKECSVDALDVAASFTGVGNYLAGAVGECHAMHKDNSKPKTPLQNEALCAQAALSFVSHASKMAALGLEIAKICAKPADRLYALDTVEASASERKDRFGAVAIFCAFAVVSALAGFSGGRFCAACQRSRQVSERHSALE